MHWPCVTGLVVYPPTGSKAYDREMSTPPTIKFGHGPSLPDLLAKIGVKIRDVPIISVSADYRPFCRQSVSAD